MNVLLIPFPYEVLSKDFTTRLECEDGVNRWGWFDVEPGWCPSSETTALERSARSMFETSESFIASLTSFVMSLLDEARRDVGAVHAVVFPEGALSSVVYARLCASLRPAKDVELVVSGLFDLHREHGAPLSKVGNGRNSLSGNYAAMARFELNDDEDKFVAREKHHRWRLERNQIGAYALGGAMDPAFIWWEGIDISNRALDVMVLRGSTTVTTLICEDLARNDPCQEVLRAIGPNLVIALLMDGAQLKQRWPARYATVLAEDPGCSVLTLTSVGMMSRVNRTGMLPKSQKIGLWRDDVHAESTELELPENADALCISLRGEAITEVSLDGRDDGGGAQSWRLAGVVPIKAGVSRPLRL